MSNPTPKSSVTEPPQAAQPARRMLQCGLYFSIPTDPPRNVLDVLDAESALLRACVAERNSFPYSSGWMIAKVYIPATQRSRPDSGALGSLIRDAKLRTIDVVVVPQLSSLARNANSLVRILSELNACNVQVHSAREGIVINSSLLRVLLGVLASLDAKPDLSRGLQPHLCMRAGRSHDASPLRAPPPAPPQSTLSRK